jgi:hypothetical protein
VKIVGPTKPRNEYINVIFETEQSIRRPDCRVHVLAQAKTELKALANKYRHLKQLSKLIKLADKLLSRSASGIP